MQLNQVASYNVIRLSPEPVSEGPSHLSAPATCPLLLLPPGWGQGGIFEFVFTLVSNVQLTSWTNGRVIFT